MTLDITERKVMTLDLFLVSGKYKFWHGISLQPRIRKALKGMPPDGAVEKRVRSLIDKDSLVGKGSPKHSWK